MSHHEAEAPARHKYEVPVRPLHNPLTAEDEATLHAIEQHHVVIHDFLKRCHNCGMDMTQQMAQHEAQAAFIKVVKEQFFPAQIPTESY